MNNNLHALVISGNPTPKELSLAWETIMHEYIEALGNSEYKLYISMYKEVEILRIDFESVNILISALRKHYSTYFISELKALLKVDFRFNINDTKSYYKDLDVCERRSKIIKIKLDLKKIDFKVLQKRFEDVDENGEQKKLDKNYFTDILIILSKYNGYRITKDIFVNEYCRYFKACAEDKK